MTTIYLHHPSCQRHDAGNGHPESPARLSAIENALLTLGDSLVRLQATPADREQLEITHDPEYVASVFDRAPDHGFVMLDPDTTLMPHSLPAALLAAGAIIQAVDWVMIGQATNAFCAVRPPGHHAEYDRAMGFCIFNNVAVGVRHAIENYGVEKVAIVDFDVHHGNGTEHIFRNEPRVLFASSYQHPHYPYSDATKAAKNALHLPLKAGSGSKEMRQAFTDTLLPALEAFEPELLFVSAGFDAHKDDPLAQLNWTADDYRWITQQLVNVANRFCQGHLISTLEGGYDLQGLSHSVKAHLEVLIDNNLSK